MNLIEARKLVDYDDWANDRVFSAASGLTPEQYAAPLVSSFPTIRDTLGHLVGAEWIWLRRWKGEHPRALPDWLVEPSFDALRARLSEVEAERRDFLGGLVEGDLDRGISFAYMGGGRGRFPLGELVAHVVNHASYHRGQVATMMRQVGAVPVSTDFVAFLGVKGV